MIKLHRLLLIVSAGVITCFLQNIEAAPKQGELRTAPLPDARELLARHFRFVGEDTLKKAKSIRITSSSSFTLPGSGEVTVQGILLWAKPDRLRLFSSMKNPLGNGETKESAGYDGKTGWSVGGGMYAMFGDNTASLSDAKVVARDLHQIYLDPVLLYFYRPDSLTTKSLTEIDGKACYEVEFKKTPMLPAFLYFDKQAGYLVRTKAPWVMPTGVTLVPTTTFGDYQRFGNLTTATNITHTTASLDKGTEVEEKEIKPAIFKTKSVTVDDVTDKELAIPEKVQALIDKEKKAQPGKK